ncbi:hypothetical protein R3P38DRAFT_2511187 [Favolaschia claudopus]|uniref:Uncharacterized protein n=1 Tax=Favolaschia claudopus TaxID=2862362 RepID=A0AAW0CT95_9AGAR
MRGPRPWPPFARCSVLALLVLFCGLVSSLAINRTIDDVFGDSVTGDMVQYLPQVPASEGSLWFNQTTCSGCLNVPEASLTFDHTWTAARYLADVGSMSISLKFTGNAIYVFFVIPNFGVNSNLASAVLCDFFIDEVHVGSFSHQSDGSGLFDYGALVYQNTSVPDGNHVLLIETTGADPAVIIFDRVIYTVDVSDAPTSSSPPPPVHTLAMSNPSPTESASPDDTDSPESQRGDRISTQSDSLPQFPSSAPSTTATVLTSILPFQVTDLPSQGHPSVPTNTSPDNAQASGVSKNSTVLIIVGTIVGTVVLCILVLLCFMLYRRRRARRAATGTISSFDLLDDNPRPPQMQRSMDQISPAQALSAARRRPLPGLPISEQYWGRSIQATQMKPSIESLSAVAGHYESNSPRFPGASGSEYHSAQSSVSSFSDAHSDLHIHIPMSTFRPVPSPLSLTPSHTPTNSQSHSFASHGNGHSPITRNGIPMSPEQADVVRGIVLGTVAVDSASMREDSVYSAGTDAALVNEDDLWSSPVMHVDSGIRFSRALMELPPQYAAT